MVAYSLSLNLILTPFRLNGPFPMRLTHLISNRFYSKRNVNYGLREQELKCHSKENGIYRFLYQI